MKVVVAGGSGLLGRALCRRLEAEGHEAVVLTRGGARPAGPGTGRAVGWRPPAPGPWTAELAGADALVNLAGESVGRWPWTRRRKAALRASRLEPTRALVAALASLPPDRRPAVLLNASGTDLYEGRDADPAGEATPPADTFLARLCLDWEREARRAEALGLRVVLLRISLVLDRSAPSLRLLALPFRLGLGGRIGSGRQWMSWIHVDDAVGLIVAALERDDLRGPLNLAAPDPRPQAAFARALARALRRPFWLPTPSALVRLALGEQAILALGSRRVWPAKALALGYRFRFDRLEPALDSVVGSVSSAGHESRPVPAPPRDR